MFLFFLTVFLILIFYLFCLKDNFSLTANLLPGQLCTKEGGDPNGSYSINYDLQCSLNSCNPGYVPDETLSSCVVNTAPPALGDSCKASDPNGIASYQNSFFGLACIITGCKNGYTVDKNSAPWNRVCLFNPGTFCRFGSDPNGFYTYDRSSNCVLESCNRGFAPDSTNTSCISNLPTT